MNRGDGIILEGNIKGRSRFSVTDKSHSKVIKCSLSLSLSLSLIPMFQWFKFRKQLINLVLVTLLVEFTLNFLLQSRYYVLHVDVHRAHKRKFESNGQEIEPNFSETHKVRTGYLNSSYSEYLSPFKFTGIPKPATTDFNISDSIISTFTPKMHFKIWRKG